MARAAADTVATEAVGLNTVLADSAGLESEFTLYRH